MASQNKKQENIFIKALLANAGTDLKVLYRRRDDFRRGRSLDYCTIGRLRLNRLSQIDEMNNPESAFRLGVEFGINIAIDTFNQISSHRARNVSKSLLPERIAKAIPGKKSKK